MSLVYIFQLEDNQDAIMTKNCWNDLLTAFVTYRILRGSLNEKHDSRTSRVSLMINKNNYHTYYLIIYDIPLIYHKTPSWFMPKAQVTFCISCLCHLLLLKGTLKNCLFGIKLVFFCICDHFNHCKWITAHRNNKLVFLTNFDRKYKNRC